MNKDLFITQNSYYFVHRHFLKFFEIEGNEVIYVSEKKSKLFKKYFEIIKYFGFLNCIKSFIYEMFFMYKLLKRTKKITSYRISDYKLNEFLKKKIIEKKYKRIISIGCPCFINPNLNKINNSILLNLHGGIIPFQRGKYSPLKSIKKRHNYLGATLHLINNKFDAGKIISQDYFKLTSGNLLENYNSVLKISSKILEEFMDEKNLSLPKYIIQYFKKIKTN